MWGRGQSSVRLRGNRAAAAATRSATSGSASSSQATPTATSSSELDLLGRELRRDRLEERSAVGDAPRHRADVVEARCERKAARGRDEIERRLETDHAAARCRNADRAAGVGSERSVGEARCERRRGAAGRAAGDSAGSEGVRDGAEVCVLRRDPVGELVQVRLADVRVAGRFGKEDGCCTLSRDVLREDRRAVRRRQACGVEQILDREPGPRRRLRRESQGRCRRPPSADLTGYLRRFGFGGFFTGAIATRRVALAP